MTATAQSVCSDESQSATQAALKWLELTSNLEQCCLKLRKVLRQSAASASLSERQAMILWLCAADPLGSAQNELARQLAVSPAQLSQLLDQLRERELIESVRDPADRRRQRSRLTPHGRSVWEQCQAVLSQEFAEQALDFSDEQLNHLCLALKQFLDTEQKCRHLKVIAADPQDQSTCKESRLP